MRRHDALLAPAAFLLLAACGKDDPSPPVPAAPPPGPAAPASPGPAPTPAPEEDHDHSPKHGGTLLEVGAHEAHLEVVHDGAAGTLAAYAYDADMKPVEVEAPVLNLTKGPVQATMTPLGGAAGPRALAWTATHEALKGAFPEGRVRLKVGDKTFQVPLEE